MLWVLPPSARLAPVAGRLACGCTLLLCRSPDPDLNSACRAHRGEASEGNSVGHRRVAQARRNHLQGQHCILETETTTRTLHTARYRCNSHLLLPCGILPGLQLVPSACAAHPIGLGVLTLHRRAQGSPAQPLCQPSSAARVLFPRFSVADVTPNHRDVLC